LNENYINATLEEENLGPPILDNLVSLNKKGMEFLSQGNY
jgi:hypothetical protein